MAARSDFHAELDGVLGELTKVYRRLGALRDLAEHDRMHSEVRRRLQAKTTVLFHTGKSLREIEDMPSVAGEGSQ